MRPEKHVSCKAEASWCPRVLYDRNIAVSACPVRQKHRGVRVSWAAGVVSTSGKCRCRRFASSVRTVPCGWQNRRGDTPRILVDDGQSTVCSRLHSVHFAVSA